MAKKSKSRKKAESNVNSSKNENKKAVNEGNANENTDNQTTKDEQQAEESTKNDAGKPDNINEEINSLNDKYLRLYSEFDNYRKRTSKEKLYLIKTAASDIISDLLPVLDDFERAQKSMEESDNCQSIKEGVNLIYNKFYKVLEKQGLKEIEAKGKEFDTDFHEAITSIPAPSEDMKGKVIDVTEKGYILNEKVVRFAKVVIGS